MKTETIQTLDATDLSRATGGLGFLPFLLIGGGLYGVFATLDHWIDAYWGSRTSGPVAQAPAPEPAPSAPELPGAEPAPSDSFQPRPQRLQFLTFT